MAITDVNAIRFSNEHIRTTADKLSRSFYLCQKLKNDWNAISGTDDEKFAIMRNDVLRVGDRIANYYGQIFMSKRLYDALSMNTLFPNDPAQVLSDGAPTDGRSVITGQDIRRINARTKEFLAWLEKAAFDDASLNPINYNFLEQFMRVNTSLVTSAWANNVISRCGDLVTEWTVTNASYLGHISKVAVNGGI